MHFIVSQEAAVIRWIHISKQFGLHFPNTLDSTKARFGQAHCHPLNQPHISFPNIHSNYNNVPPYGGRHSTPMVQGHNYPQDQPVAGRSRHTASLSPPHEGYDPSAPQSLSLGFVPIMGPSLSPSVNVSMEPSSGPSRIPSSSSAHMNQLGFQVQMKGDRLSERCDFRGTRLRKLNAVRQPCGCYVVLDKSSGEKVGIINMRDFIHDMLPESMHI